METRNNYIVPFEAAPPGGVLECELEERGIALEDFAMAIDLPYSFFSELLVGDHPVTAEIAMKFEKILGIPAIHWLRMQDNYEYDKKVLAERENAKHTNPIEQLQPEMA